jgi:hypothetical protein
MLVHSARMVRLRNALDLSQPSDSATGSRVVSRASALDARTVREIETRALAALILEASGIRDRFKQRDLAAPDGFAFVVGAICAHRQNGAAGIGALMNERHTDSFAGGTGS